MRCAEVVFALGELAQRQGKPRATNQWYKPTGGLYTDAQFNALYNFVRQEFRACQARALIIIHAEHLDTVAFKMLHRWYEYRKRQFGLILSFTMAKNAAVDDALQRLYKAIPKEWVEDPVELKQLDPVEFGEKVLPKSPFGY